MRSLIVAACLAAFFSMSSNANAASSGQRTNVSYSSSYASGSSSSSQMSRAAEQPVPANCIRQECGKLWCWQMGGGKR